MPARVEPKVTKVGKATLSVAAAASYARMLAAGMPENGFVVGYRTWDQQNYLYKNQHRPGFNPAAHPDSPKAYHRKADAMDVSTGSPQQRWLSAGDSWQSIGRKPTRANEYGWVRDVPGEPWHFHYIASRDRHRNTPKPPVEPPKPPTARTVEVLLGVANCQSYDGSKTQKAWEARGWLMAREKRTVWVVTETTSAGRAVLQKMLGPSWKWKVWTLAGKSVGVLFDSSVWEWRKIRKTSVWTSFGHGTVAVPLVHKATGIGIDVLGHHTPPGSVASDATKDKRITQGAALAGGWPAIYAGDFARNTPTLPGWRRAGKAVDTMDKPGMQSVDDAYVRGLISIAEARVVDPGKWSDHKWRAYRFIVSAKPDTN